MRTATELLEDLPRLAGIPETPGETMSSIAARGEDGSLDFSGAAGMETQAERTNRALTSTVRAGGVDGVNRHDAFGQAFGHHLRCVREGRYSLAEAEGRIRGWIAANMVPPWNEAKIVAEMKGLTGHVERAHGPFPASALGAPGENGPAPSAPAWVSPGMVKLASHVEDVDFEAWKIGSCFSGPVPQRVFLVRGLIQAGRSHALAAEAGAGKTETVYDLALRLAAACLDAPQLTWWGQPIGAAAYDGTVIFITTEDGRDELHIRLNKDDHTGELARLAADRLIVLPLVDLGGARPLMRKNPRTGEVEATEWWAKYRDKIAAVPRVTAIIFDTLNSLLHGEDVSPAVIQEWFNEVNKLGAKLGAAVIVTHHLRKAGKTQIKTLRDMRDEVRGSSALPAAVRCLLGFWEPRDAATRLKALGLPQKPSTLYLAGVLKANNDEFYRGTKVLVRDEHGVFIDRTKEEAATSTQVNELEAWMLAAIRHAALDDHPLYCSATALGSRRGKLPEKIRGLSDPQLAELVKGLLDKNAVVHCKPAKGRDGALDVPGGKFTEENMGSVESGAWNAPDWSTYEWQPVAGRVQWPSDGKEAKHAEAYQLRTGAPWWG